MSLKGQLSIRTFDVYVCSTTLIHELGQGDSGPWRIYLNSEDIECCKNKIGELCMCKPVKVTLSWNENED
jgi:hypothetical protein